jgi:hypothetical protein
MCEILGGFGRVFPASMSREKSEKVNGKSDCPSLHSPTVTARVAHVKLASFFLDAEPIVWKNVQYMSLTLT